VLPEYDETTYGEAIAEIYDDLYPSLDERTVGVLADLARASGGSGRALELGIGTGRIAIPLAASGVRVEGIESSPAMLEHLRDKAGGEGIPVTLGNFADVDVEGEYDLVFVTFNTLYMLEHQEQQVRCFEGVARHLRPGGAFVVEGFVPDLARYTNGQYVSAPRIGLGAVMLDVSHLDPVRQLITAEHVYLANDYVRLYPVRLRYVWPSEMDLMARCAGLRLRERWSGWGHEPFTDQSPSQIAVYEKPLDSLSQAEIAARA
jgi:SAM-dependent methyltransferase